ncbi:MAG: S41 family peptidase [Eubacteriales bacterium]|nr:S41 family peptidase [Eubacteriales bacterium]
MENKEFIKGLAVGVLSAAVIGFGGYLGYVRANPAHSTVLSDRTHVEKLGYLESLIDTYYLEEKDEDNLAEGLYAGLIAGLGDPYSRYYTAEQYEDENSSTEGAYVGIGIMMQKNRQGGVLVVECYEGGPGEAAGLKAGDIISAVDGTDITDTDASEVVDMIKVKVGESVTLTIHRENEENALDINVPVTDVELHSVFHEMLDERTGYIRITEFKGVTYEQYKTAFADLKDKGMERLVVDLRSNPGGLLDSVCDILNEILPEGLIVYTEDKYGNRDEKTSDGGHTLDMPLAVLVNEGSASASEIFAGAVQDYGTGTIVGTTTYGKGVVQSIRQLDDGSAVKLTISNYYTPKGNNINKVGITPDVEVKLDPDLLNKDDITHEEDNQLQAAISSLDNK